MTELNSRIKNALIKIDFIKRYDVTMYLSIALIAAVIFLRMYGTNILNPTYVDWLMTGGDLSQHYLGWSAYRASGWHFPIGMVDTLAYPYETSIIFTDSIPLFALFFKLLSPILSHSFQYFGIWGIVCFILQGVFAGRVIRHRTDSRVITVIAGALFVLTPAMIWRMYIHTALAGQWIIIFTLDMVINPDKYQEKMKAYLFAAIIGFLSAAIHIYFVLINGIVLTGYVIITFFKERKPKKGLISLVIYLVSVTCTVWLFGGFNSGMAAQNTGLGVYSFNLNSFVNPLRWSKVFKEITMYGSGQQEGFSYLGAGVILLVFMAVCFCLIKITNAKKSIKDNGVQIIAIGVICVLSIVVAASPTVTIGDRVLADFNLPKIITDIWSIFRASGRIIWATVYLIMFLAVIGLLQIKRKKLCCLILGLVLILQAYDISDVINEKYKKFNERIEYQSFLTTVDFWDILAADTQIKHVLYYSSADQGTMYSITNWALENGKTLNDFYFARSIDELVDRNRERALKELPNDTIYIFSADEQLNCIEYSLHYYDVDGLIVGCVNPVEGFSEINNFDLSQTWIFSGNQYLVENTGIDTDEGRILYTGGLSYGPRWNIPDGQYEIEISGEALSSDVNVAIYGDYGQIMFEHTEMFRDNSVIRLYFKAEEATDNLEILITNNSGENIILKSINMRFVKNT